MFRMVMFAAALALASAGAAVAQAPVVIEEVKAGADGKVVTFDATGKRLAPLPLDAFPKAPFPAAGYDAASRRVKVATPQGEVWLAPIQVRTSVRAEVMTECETTNRLVDAKTDAGRSHASRGLGGCSR